MASLRLGEFLYATASSGRCWTHGSLAHPFDRSDPGPSLLVIADRLLATDDAPFEEHVEVEKLFQMEPFADAVAASPLLQLRAAPARPGC